MKHPIILLLVIFNSINLTAQVNQVWVNTYNGGNSSEIGLDNSGNLIVTGNFSTGSQGFGTIKYDASGSQLWASSYNLWSGVNAYALAVDDSGNAYVTGRVLEGNNVPANLTVKYNSSGVQQWSYVAFRRMIRSTKTICIDRSGFIYVATYFVAGGGATTFSILKFSSSGIVIWSTLNTSGVPVAIKTAPSGNIYAAGYSGNSGAGTEYTILKFDSAGSLRWTRNFYENLNEPNVLTGIAVDGSDNIYATGYSCGMLGDTNYATVKYDSSGNMNWSALYGGVNLFSNKPTSIAVDLSGNAYVTGYSVGNGTGRDYSTLKYDNNGIQQWVERYNGTGNGDDIANDLKVDRNSNIYVTGSSIGAGTGYDYATLKYSNAGALQWIIRYNDSASADDYGNSLVVDNSGNVYVTGTGNNEYVTIKYSQLTGINPVSSEIPNSYSLHQNYPNPFNPSTKIKFAVPKNGDVKLIVYDAIGRDVATLVNEPLKPGSYEVEWNASGFPSGVYFYELISAEFSETKKLIFLK